MPCRSDAVATQNALGAMHHALSVKSEKRKFKDLEVLILCLILAQKIIKHILHHLTHICTQMHIKHHLINLYENEEEWRRWKKSHIGFLLRHRGRTFDPFCRPACDPAPDWVPLLRGRQTKRVKLWVPRLNLGESQALMLRQILGSSVT